jgi:phage terminase large subunit GpA-like protein
VIATASPAGTVREAAAVLEPPPDLTVTQWAETYRVLSAVDSAAAGRFSCDERPYQRGIMDACSVPRIQFVTVAGPSQWGKTQILNNILGSRIHLNPGPIMAVAPTIHAVEKWSKTRFMPMVRDCPELAERIGEGRNTSNTITEKEFPGGVLVCVGANVPSGLAQQPIRDLLMDEIDRIPIDESAGKEGDFEELAEARTSDFEGRRLIYRCSSPTIKGRSRIENSLKESDWRLWWWRCPHCGHLQVCDFRQVVFDGRPKDPVYACRGGGCEITEHQLRQAINRAESEGGGWIAQHPEVDDHAGFQVHGLMVRSMASLVAKFQRAKRKGPKALQVWVNTQCGEWWDPREGDDLQVDGLLARARQESYVTGEVPEGVALLVAGVDNQTSPQRLEVGVWGVGVGMELWLIEHRVIPGNLATQEPWNRLEELLLQDWDGHRIKAVGLDVGGHYNKPVYAFCKRPKMRGLAHPVKGATQPQRTLVRRATKKSSLRLVDGVSAKDLIYGQLAIEKPGPGYVHLPNDVDQGTIEQLLSERPCTKSGRRAYEKKDGPDTRNEVLDCVVYSYAALEIYAPRDLEALVQRNLQARAPQAAPEPDPEAEDAPTAPVRRIAPRRGGGGMTGFGGAW